MYTALGFERSSRLTVTVSQELIFHVRHIYDSALQQLDSWGTWIDEFNGYTTYALPAYVTAVAAVEAFVNEAFLSFMAQENFRNSPLWELSRDWLERTELRAKLVLIPQLLFKQSLSRASQPYQDMSLLISVRNSVVHYKLQFEAPKYLKSLDQRRISISTGAEEDYPWPRKIATSEGIRWAHNTACATVLALTNLVTVESYRNTLGAITDNFSPLPDSYAEEWRRAHGSNKGECP